jgi:DNA modification methylase
VTLTQNDSRSTLWQVSRDSAAAYKHPTQKPVELATRAVSNSSQPGDIVLDLFLGSGSTLIGAEQLSRRCFGMELDPKYVDVCIERWCNYTGNDKETIYGQVKA